MALPKKKKNKEAEEKMELWHVLLGIAFLLAILTFAYLLIGRLRRRKRVIKILKEAKAL